MAQKGKKSKEWRIWPSALLVAAHRNPKTVTTADLVDELDIEPSSACQVLRRLQSWGLLRVSSFVAATGAERRGRRRKVYELTPAGERKVKRIRKASGRA